MSIHTKIAPVLLEFVANMHLQPFVHGMQGPTWVIAQGFVGALDIFLGRNASPGEGVVCVEREAVFPLDHFPVRLSLQILPALTAPSNPLARAHYKMGSGVSQEKQQIFADGYESLLSTPRRPYRTRIVISLLS